ncbi:hypothetical protein [Parvularcula dongshanensis]|uniref:Uncharacterized protein n=1 Tax=Parvularcula dongshanensis TaxID=1173995 RepID=A0A840I5S7_9PROT|nr:hypothetical protein [Parvularcula dongshanensis]MBB4659370.1 hypothetical protein [Parvularcula dongshanensis]
MQERARRWGRNFNSNTIIALAALVTSVVAVFVAWDESRLLRKSQRAAFMPILEVQTTLSTAADDLRVSIEVRNSGNGVAYVKSADLLIDAEPAEDYQAFASAILPPSLARSADFSWATLRGYYQANESQKAMTFRWPENEENREDFLAFLATGAQAAQEKMALSLCYCSVFGECWTTSMDEEEPPEPIAECPAPHDPIEALWRSYFAARGEVGVAEPTDPLPQTPPPPAAPR